MLSAHLILPSALRRPPALISRYRIHRYHRTVQAQSFPQFCILEEGRLEGADENTIRVKMWWWRQ